MDKEQKKLLLVAISVGVFLLVTTTVAIILLTPRVNTQDNAFSSSQTVQPGRIQPAENLISQPVVNNIQETIPDSFDNIEATNNSEELLTIQIPRPNNAAVPNNTEVTPSVNTRTTAPVAAAPAPATPAATVIPASAAQPAARPAATTAASARTVNDYWVQTGAFTARIRAEDEKEFLASKGFVSIIENREIDGRMWYRVRLGPYTSEREANYWLALVKSIDGFNESQVRQTTRQL